MAPTGAYRRRIRGGWKFRDNTSNYKFPRIIQPELTRLVANRDMLGLAGKGHCLSSLRLPLFCHAQQCDGNAFSTAAGCTLFSCTHTRRLPHKAAFSSQIVCFAFPGTHPRQKNHAYFRVIFLPFSGAPSLSPIKPGYGGGAAKPLDSSHEQVLGCWDSAVGLRFFDAGLRLVGKRRPTRGPMANPRRDCHDYPGFLLPPPAGLDRRHLVSFADPGCFHRSCVARIGPCKPHRHRRNAGRQAAE